MNNLGLIYIQQDRSDDALLPLARAVELRSNSPVFQNNLGTALERTGHVAAAKQAYEAAVGGGQQICQGGLPAWPGQPAGAAGRDGYDRPGRGVA